MPVIIPWLLPFYTSLLFLSLACCHGYYVRDHVEQKWSQWASSSSSWFRRKAFSVPSFSMMLSGDIFNDSFYKIDISSFHNYSLGVFYRYMLNLGKVFFCIYWDDLVTFVLVLVYVMITFIDVYVLNHCCIPGMLLTSRYTSFLMICCMSFVRIFWGVVHLCSLEILAYSSNFWDVSLPDSLFWNLANISFQKWLWLYSFSFDLIKDFMEYSH